LFQSRYHTWLVGVVFGILSILTGLLIIPLPETGNKSMPQTIEDVENICQKVPKKRKDANQNAFLRGNDEGVPLAEASANQHVVVS
jgi:hypothetical protein